MALVIASVMVMGGLLWPGRDTAPQSLILNRYLKMTALVHERVKSDCALPAFRTRLHFHQELLDDRGVMHRLLLARVLPLGQVCAPWHASHKEAPCTPPAC